MIRNFVQCVYVCMVDNSKSAAYTIILECPRAAFLSHCAINCLRMLLEGYTCKNGQRPRLQRSRDSALRQLWALDHIWRANRLGSIDNCDSAGGYISQAFMITSRQGSRLLTATESPTYCQVQLTRRQLDENAT